MSVALPDNFSLEYLSAGPSTYSNIDGVTSFDEGNVAAEEVDVSDFDSAGNRREFEPGMIDASEGSFTVNYEPGNVSHEWLRSKVGAAAVTLRSKDGTTPAMITSTFTCLIKACSKPRTIGGRRDMTVTIKCTGVPTEVVS